VNSIPVPDREPAALTVLVVDDEDILRRIMTRALTDGGYQVLVAADGAAAWELVRSAQGGIQAVVTDLVMPRMGGVELAAWIATLPSPPPVVLISGYAHDKRELDLPFLAKPFRPDQLVTMIGQVLAGNVPAITSPPPGAP
jgi:CheY-like chemotaxis protein